MFLPTACAATVSTRIPTSLWRSFFICASTVSIVAAVAPGCGSDGGSTFVGGSADSGLSQDGQSSSGSPGIFGGDGSSNDEGGPSQNGALVVTPSSAVVQVTIANGVITQNAPVTFSATYAGLPITPAWSIDRGEVGDVTTAGIFTASVKASGIANVTATYGAKQVSAQITVNIANSQNGNSAGADAGADAGSGGFEGVGGEAPGGPIVAGLETRLRSESNTSDLAWLYPYDKTVFPRGLLAPLLQWNTAHTANAVYVKISQKSYTFEGFYSMATYTGVQTERVHLDDGAWGTATDNNGGDPLQVQVKIYDATTDTVYGPITENWTIASGVLKGTVYYNSYDSHLTGGAAATIGGVLAIKPGVADPSLAVPANSGKCFVCHELSANGQQLFVQDGDYMTSASYDLTKSAARTAYTVPSAGTPNDHKFAWSAVYPDGTFAMVAPRFAREAYLQADASLYSSKDASQVAANGLTGVIQSAVTPTYSPDGRKIAFNFWEGAGAGGVTAGAGRSLSVMDFSCGATTGSLTCAAPPYAFSGLRELYRDPARYPSWPAFTPDAKALIFHNTITGGNCGSNPPDRTSPYNCQLTTWYGAQSELWYVRDSAGTDAGASTAARLDAANGFSGAASYLPTNAKHPNDGILNYQPTVNPVASGGFYWVVFTSRRMYGNVLVGDPYNSPDNPTDPTQPETKKLWVAAIDINPTTSDASHPAFYLPGQAAAGNSRGFWVVDPCKTDGSSCETGDECCNGFCRKGDGGALVCGGKPPGATCAQEFEACTVSADCCDPSLSCIGGRCSQSAPVK